MKFQHCISILAVLGYAVAVPVSERTWTTLTPSGTIPSSVGAKTDFDGSFALSIKTLADSASTTASSKDKRDVAQISDGQIQQQTAAKATASVINQIGDGQIQQQTTAKQTASVVNQIGDGQIQQQTATKQTASVVNQIGDGQIQQQTAAKHTASVVNQIGDGQIQQQTAAKQTASVVNQIGDGQIQQQTAAKATASVVNQITDGQIQQQTAKATASAVAQISDGQIQQTTKKGQATQISDGQVQATKAAEASTDSDGFEETCLGDDALALRLKGGELTDAKGRIGAIVANRQFQFDGPPPQAGTIYAGGWSIVPASYSSSDKTKRDTESWKLALGTQTTFYKCKSGDFYNLYDQSIGGQCSPIEIEILKAVSC